MLKLLGDLERWLTTGGSWNLQEHEKLVLDAALASLDEQAQALARRQLAHRFFVERNNEGRINVLRFYRIDEQFSIQSTGFDDLLIKVRLTANGRKHTAHVTFYKGWVFSIEFKKPGKEFRRAQLSVEDILVGDPSETFTAVIDRHEHGRSEVDRE